MYPDKTKARFIQELETRYLGTHENPVGAGLNNSPVNQEYGASGPSWPWCAMTMWLAAMHAGFVIPKTASVYQFRTWAQFGQHGLIWVPVGQQQPGDLFCYTGDRHIGMFNYASGSGFWSIEGNWGDACVRVYRPNYRDIAGFVRLPFAELPVPPAPPAPPAAPSVPATHVAVPGTLRNGDQGLEVALVQLRLNNLRGLLIYSGQQVEGSWVQLAQDGQFGLQTQAAVSAFQRRVGAGWEAGIWGKLTQAKMSQYEAALGIHY